MKIYLKEYVLGCKDENGNKQLINVDVDKIVDILITCHYPFFPHDLDINIPIANARVREKVIKLKDKNTT
jgi:hypothetical protein